MSKCLVHFENWEVQFTIITHETERYLRLKEIVAPYGFLSISRSSWYAGIANGRFPAPIKLSARTAIWKYSAVVAAIEDAAAGP